jgi:hypothetical protein
MWVFEITWAIGRVGLKVEPVLGPEKPPLCPGQLWVTAPCFPRHAEPDSHRLMYGWSGMLFPEVAQANDLRNGFHVWGL